MNGRAPDDQSSDLFPEQNRPPTRPHRHGRTETLVERLGFQDPDRATPAHDLACAYLSAHAETIAAAHLARRPMELPSPPPPVAPNGNPAHGWVANQAREAMFKTVPTAELVETGTVTIDTAQASTEVALVKGENQYKTIVGFLDVVILYTSVRTGCTFTVGRLKPGPQITCRDCQGTGTRALQQINGAVHTWRCDACEQGMSQTWEWDRTRRTRTPQSTSRLLVLEVKISRVSIGDVLRQITLYRQYAAALEYNRDYKIAPSAWWLVTPYALSAADLALLAQAQVVHFALGEKFRTWCAAQQTPTESPEL